METNNKSPLLITQTFLAILSARKEAIEKFGDTLEHHIKLKAQNELFIEQWMEELSNYGDAVGSPADTEISYVRLWNSITANAEKISPDESVKLFAELETHFKNYFRALDTGKEELPASLQEILSDQQIKLG